MQARRTDIVVFGVAGMLEKVDGDNDPGEGTCHRSVPHFVQHRSHFGSVPSFDLSVHLHRAEQEGTACNELLPGAQLQ